MSSVSSKRIYLNRACFVPGCTIGYKSNTTKLTLFSTPKDEELFDKWAKSIARSDKCLDRFSVVCEAHFEERFILRDYRYVIEGKEVLLPRTRPCLTEDAFPSIFPNLLKYSKKKFAHVRSNSTRSPPHDGSTRSNIEVMELGVRNSMIEVGTIVEASTKITSTNDMTYPNDVLENSALSPPHDGTRSCIEVDTTVEASAEIINSNDMTYFKYLVLESLTLPLNWYKTTIPEHKLYIFTNHKNLNTYDEKEVKNIMECLSSPRKIVVVKENNNSFSCSTYFNFKLIKTNEASSSLELDNHLKEANDLSVCTGAGNLKEFEGLRFKNFDIFNNTLFSKNCQGSASRFSKTRIISCVQCKSARKRILNIKSKSKYLKDRTVCNVKDLRNKNKKLTLKVRKLKREVNSLKNLMWCFSS